MLALPAQNAARAWGCALLVDQLGGGPSPRALRRWQRMRAVGQGLAAGRNLTEAAHELEFTDSPI